LREAARLDPAEAMYWYNLGTTLKEFRSDLGDEAIDALLTAFELDHSHYPTLRNLALALERSGRGREAEDICTRIEEAGGVDDPAVLSILGRVALRDGDLTRAENRFKRLLDLEPESIHVHLHLATIYRRQGDLERSREHTDKAVALDPEKETFIREGIERDE